MINSSIYYINPVHPRIFFKRILKFVIFLSFIQFFHLFFLTTSGIDVLLTWLIFYSVLFLIFSLYSKLIKNISFFSLSYKFILIFFIIGFIGKLIAKFDYIQSWLSFGLQATRHSTEISGGWSTYLAVWFYPASILLAFTRIPSKKVYLFILLMLAIVIFIEFIFVGTRGGPMLVVLFYIFAMRKKLKSKHIVIASIILLAVFSYSTQYRTLASELGIFSWTTLLENTISTEIVQIKPEIISFCDNHAPFLFPFIFLFHYLSHSIGEFTYLINMLDGINTGGANYFLREICITGLCDQNIYTEAAENLNIRGAVYTTLLGTLIYDSSLLISILIVIFVVIFNSFLIILFKKIDPLTVSILVILSVSSIGNYFYTGLGLIQFFLMLVIYFIGIIYNSGLRQILSTANKSH